MFTAFGSYELKERMRQPKKQIVEGKPSINPVRNSVKQFVPQRD
jgi:hypothetical protein